MTSHNLTIRNCDNDDDDDYHHIGNNLILRCISVYHLLLSNSSTPFIMFCFPFSSPGKSKSETTGAKAIGGSIGGAVLFVIAFIVCWKYQLVDAAFEVLCCCC